jgi:hypothetical protein
MDACVATTLAVYLIMMNMKQEGERSTLSPIMSSIQLTYTHDESLWFKLIKRLFLVGKKLSTGVGSRNDSIHIRVGLKDGIC